MNYDSLLLASGGMDSTVLAYKLASENRKVLLLFLDYGQHCMNTEYETLKKVVPERYKNDIRILRIGDIYKESNSRMIKEANLWEDNVTAEDLYLPYRNILFLSLASAYAQSLGIKNVYSAFINSNHAKEIDCSIEFFNRLESLLFEFGSICIHTPFRDLSKTEVARLGVALNVPIESTFSCQVNSKNPCGACPNCVDRIIAINNILGDIYDVKGR
jgi:7-cyano-7-deazaguanine synthase